MNKSAIQALPDWETRLLIIHLQANLRIKFRKIIPKQKLCRRSAATPLAYRTAGILTLNPQI